MKRYSRIHIIINPAAGNNEPMLNIINDTLKDAEIDWQVSVTHKKGDGARLARQAVQDGVDLVMAYGGDGTLLDVAEGMLEAEIPIAFFTGGTANAMVDELGIPRPLHEAVGLILGDHDIQTIDVGMVNDKDLFLIRVGTGIIAEYSTTVNREMKDQYGLIAYLIGALKAITHAKSNRYTLTIDGVVHEYEGVMCLVTNASSTGGQSNVRLAKEVLINDGLLDVIIPKGDFLSYVDMLTTAVQVAQKSFQTDSVQHFQGREIIIDADEPLGLFADGEEEPLGLTPIKIGVKPATLKVIVPKTLPSSV